MKQLLCVLSVLMLALPGAAYQTGPQNRTNFGGAQAAQAGQGQYRSFSNYNHRSWGQGVQTHGVQTQVAGSSATDFEKKKPVGKAQASAPKPAKPVQPAVPTAQPGASGQPAQPQGADPAALMQQVQTMMSTMGGQTAQPGAQAGQPGAQGQPGAALPDISALMGGAMPAVPAANPTATPVKK